MHVTVAGLVLEYDPETTSNKVLIGRKGPSSSYAGRFVLPGGKPETDEPLDEATKREVLEETGVEIDHLSLFGVYTHRVITDSDTNSRLVVVFLAMPKGAYGEPVPGDDIEDAAWATTGEVRWLRSRLLAGLNLVTPIMDRVLLDVGFYDGNSTSPPVQYTVVEEHR
jgi:8-oxo-dGTP diphosphatase